MLFQFYGRGGTGTLQNLVYNLQQWGLYDVILPFLLIFAILFAVLQRVNLFKKPAAAGAVPEPERKINAIIAIVISLIIVLPHVTKSYPINADPVVIINKILPGSAIIIIAALMVLLLIGLTGVRIPGFVTLVTAIVSVIVLAIIFLSAVFPTWQWKTGPLSDPNLQALIIVLLVFGIVVWFIVREPPKEPFARRLEALGKAIFGTEYPK